MPEPVDLAAFHSLHKQWRGIRLDDALMARRRERLAHHMAAALPGVLDLVDEQAARIAGLEGRLDAANARTAERCNQLMAAHRDIEQLGAERDHSQAAARTASLRLCAVRVLAGELARRLGVDEQPIAAAIRNIADPTKPFLGLAPVPSPFWGVVDEVHMTSAAQLADAVERASDVKPPERPQEPSGHPRTRETGVTPA